MRNCMPNDWEVREQCIRAVSGTSGEAPNILNLDQTVETSRLQGVTHQYAATTDAMRTDFEKKDSILAPLYFGL